MAKILLDYVFPISVVPSVPAASIAFLKQAIVVAKPKTGQEGNVGQIFECANMAAVEARTDNDNAEQLFNAGMSKVYVLLADDLDLAAPLASAGSTAWTVLISDDFDDDDLEEVTVPAVAASVKIQDITYTAKTAGTAGNSLQIAYADTNSDGQASASKAGSVITVSIESGVTPASAIKSAIEGDTDSNAAVAAVVDSGDESDPQVTASATNLAGGDDATTTSGDLDVGTFGGVVGFSSDDAETCQAFAATENRCAFLTSDTNGAKNMFYAFGKLLSNLVNWTNQQYITMPVNDEVDTLGDANSLFDDRVSFVINDSEFANRLALFAAGGKAIIAPYIKKNLQVDAQSRTLSWIAANQPQYTLTSAALLESRLQSDVIDAYVTRKWITEGRIEIKLEQTNFVASGYFTVPDPTALWRVFGEMRSE